MRLIGSCKLIAPLFALALVAACGQDGGDTRKKSAAQGKQGIADATLANVKRESMAGAKLVRRKCESCHYLDRNLRKVGPPLKGVYGRKPRISGVPFDAWNEKALDQWIENPKKVKPRTTMAIPGIKSKQDRTAMIDFLKTL